MLHTTSRACDARIKPKNYTLEAVRAAGPATTGNRSHWSRTQCTRKISMCTWLTRWHNRGARVFAPSNRPRAFAVVEHVIIHIRCVCVCMHFTARAEYNLKFPPSRTRTTLPHAIITKLFQVFRKHLPSRRVRLMAWCVYCVYYLGGACVRDTSMRVHTKTLLLCDYTDAVQCSQHYRTNLSSSHRRIP